MSQIVVGSSVRTVRQMYFVEAIHPDTGKLIEVMFPRWHRLTVCGVDRNEGTVNVSLPDGFVATLSIDDVEDPI